MSLPANTISTADWVAAARDWHLRNTAGIFEDPYARKLCGRRLRLVCSIRPLEWLVFKIGLDPILPASMCVLMRARYAEESLARLVEAGIRQYVILGAGMDSFAFRRRDLVGRIDSFEVDHPVTQRKKLQRIERAGLEVPPNHHFVAADLSEVSPVDALSGTAFDASEPAFISLLGVSYYLTREDLASALRGIADGMCKGTSIVVDYMLDIQSSDPATYNVRRKMLEFVERRGEPMRSSFSMEAMHDVMAEAGLKAVEHIRMTDLAEAYTRNLPTLGVELPDMFGFGNFEVT